MTTTFYYGPLYCIGKFRYRHYGEYIINSPKQIDRTLIILASTILLATSTSVFAGIPEDLNLEGATNDGIITAALANCTGNACEADVLIETIANN
jgi:hypothetical protein